MIHPLVLLVPFFSEINHAPGKVVRDELGTSQLNSPTYPNLANQDAGTYVVADISSITEVQ